MKVDANSMNKVAATNDCQNDSGKNDPLEEDKVPPSSFPHLYHNIRIKAGNGMTIN